LSSYKNLNIYNKFITIILIVKFFIQFIEKLYGIKYIRIFVFLNDFIMKKLKQIDLNYSIIELQYI